MIRGALAAILSASRLVGVAPFVKKDNGLRVSPPLVIINRILAFVTALVHIPIEVYLAVNRTRPWTSMELVECFTKISMFTIAMTGLYTAKGRMRRLGYMLDQLSKLESKIVKRDQGKNAEKKVICFIVAYYLSNIIVRLLEIVFTVFASHQGWVFFAGSIKNVCITQMNILLHSQLALITRKVLLSLTALNDTLEELAEKHSTDKSGVEITYETLRLAWSEFMPLRCQNRNPDSENSLDRKKLGNLKLFRQHSEQYVIRQLAEGYATICNFVNQINDAEGFILVLTLGHYLLRLGANFYKLLFMGFLSPDKKPIAAIFAMLSCAITMIGLILFVEPFHRTYIQMDRTSSLVNRMKASSSHKAEVRNELALFLRLLDLKQASYSPLDVCTISRLLIFKILGCLITFLTFILTYGPELRD